MNDGVLDGVFRLAHYRLPCCGSSVTLNDLEYDWPQAFGRFRWEVRNPNKGELVTSDRMAIEAAAGVPLVFVYKRL